MSRELFISVTPAEIRTARRDDGVLLDIVIERKGGGSLVGNIYLGRVEHVSGSVDAAFVDIGLPRPGFLPFYESGTDRMDRNIQAAVRPHEGQKLLVQVAKDASGSKGVQLTRRASLPGRFLVYAPTQDRVTISRKIDRETERERLALVMSAIAAPGEGFILRTASGAASDADLEAEARQLRNLWTEIARKRSSAGVADCLHGEVDPLLRVLRDQRIEELDRIHVDDRRAAGLVRDYCNDVIAGAGTRVKFYASPHDMFEHLEFNGEIQKALQNRIALPSGGGLVIEKTEALTAIDVNSGKSGVGFDSRQTAFRVNCEAASEAVRQIRLRNLAGLIVIDFIRMESEDDRQQLLEVLRNSVASDPVSMRIHGITSAGLVEITRRRQRESLSQIMTATCDVCRGEGVVPSPESVGHDVLRSLRSEARVCPPGPLVVRVAPEVAHRLEGQLSAALEEIRIGTGRAIELSPKEDYTREQFDIHSPGRGG